MGAPRRAPGILWIAAGLSAAAGLGYFVLGVMSGSLTFLTSSNPEVTAPENRKLSVGSPAPDFLLETLDGKPVRLQELRGKSVMLHFWATWCEPCKEEMPEMEERYVKYSPDLEVLAVNFAEPEQEVREFTRRMGITFDVLVDSNAGVQELYRVRGYPTSYFIDSEGVIRARHIGSMTEQEIDRFLKRAGVGD